MKSISIFSLVMMVSLCAEAAGDRVNSKESLRLCKEAVEADKPAGMVYKFKRNSATSVSSSSYKHWINYVEISGSEKSMKKLLCETSRTGEILGLKIESGRWKM